MTTKSSDSDSMQRGGAREDGAKQRSYDPFCVTHDLHAPLRSCHGLFFGTKTNKCRQGALEVSYLASFGKYAQNCVIVTRPSTFASCKAALSIPAGFKPCSCLRARRTFAMPDKRIDSQIAACNMPLCAKCPVPSNSWAIEGFFERYVVQSLLQGQSAQVQGGK